MTPELQKILYGKVKTRHRRRKHVYNKSIKTLSKEAVPVSKEVTSLNEVPVSKEAAPVSKEEAPTSNEDPVSKEEAPTLHDVHLANQIQLANEIPVEKRIKFLKAADQGDHNTIEKMLEADRPIVHVQDKSNNNALVHAATHGHTSIARLLMEMGSTDKEKAQMGAEEQGHEEVANMLKNYVKAKDLKEFLEKKEQEKEEEKEVEVEKKEEVEVDKDVEDLQNTLDIHTWDDKMDAQIDAELDAKLKEELQTDKRRLTKKPKIRVFRRTPVKKEEAATVVKMVPREVEDKGLAEDKENKVADEGLEWKRGQTWMIGPTTATATKNGILVVDSHVKHLYCIGNSTFHQILLSLPEHLETLVIHDCPLLTTLPFFSVPSTLKTVEWKRK